MRACETARRLVDLNGRARDRVAAARASDRSERPRVEPRGVHRGSLRNDWSGIPRNLRARTPMPGATPAAYGQAMPAALVRQAKIVDVTLRDGRRVRAWRAEGGDTPLVLLHGTLDSSEGWSAVAGSSRRPVVAFDVPGFGASDPPSRPRIGAYAEDLAEAMLRLELDEVTLVGHSLGGAIAAALVELLPERVASLVLLAPAGFGRIRLAEMISAPGVRSAAAALLPFALKAPLVASAGYRLFVTAGAPPPAGVIERVKRNATALTSGAVLGTQAVIADGRARDGLSKRRIAYAGPVAVLWGEADRVVSPRHADGLLRAFPQATIITWPDMGHHPQCERPAALAAFVEAACRRAAPRAVNSRRGDRSAR
jgi:pimeloyl-ACP methyl ester carboxylesterase